MGRTKKPYTLYVKKQPNAKEIWYYRTYDEFGIRTSGRSTGETSKTKAEIYCIELFKNNNLIPDSSIKLVEYIKFKNFFTWGKCDYCNENKLTQKHADQCLSKLTNHILPTLGNVTFASISSRMISSWQTQLLNKKKLSPKTVRNIRSVLYVILDSAKSDEYLTKDIKNGVKKLPRYEKNERGILTSTEVQNIFDTTNMDEYWKGNIYYYTASLLACYTGMRQGEILALTPDKIYEDHIYVNESYSNKYGLGKTKTKETRQVYLNSTVKKALNNIMPESGFIFTLNGDKPLTGQRLTEALYRALERAGINKEQRIKRNITFHSFRHYFVTLLRDNGITNSEITSITGQKTIKIIDDYTKYNKLSNKNIINVLENKI